MFVVTRFDVPEDTASDFVDRVSRVVEALSRQRGYLGARVGRAVDEVSLWMLATEWDGVGAWRRALSAFDVRVEFMPLAAFARDEPGAFEVLLAQDGPTGTARRAPSALAPDAARGVDVSTSRFLPEAIVKWADRADPVKSIADAIAALLGDPAECARRQAEALAFARSSLPAWGERIDMEIRIFEGVAKGDAPPLGTLPWDRLAQIAYAVSAE